MRGRLIVSALIVFGLLAAGVVYVGSEGLTALIRPTFRYPVKFVCGTGDDLQVVAGVYNTAINVHNPSLAAQAVFAKKVALAFPNQDPESPKSDFRKPSWAPTGPGRSTARKSGSSFRGPPFRAPSRGSS